MSSDDPRPEMGLRASVRLILLSGAALSLVLLILGGALGISTVKEADDIAVSLPELAPHLLDAEPMAIISLGLIVLMLTPALAVVAMGTAFFISRNYFYGFICLLVLAVLLFSLFTAT